MIWILDPSILGPWSPAPRSLSTAIVDRRSWSKILIEDRRSKIPGQDRWMVGLYGRTV